MRKTSKNGGTLPGLILLAFLFIFSMISKGLFLLVILILVVAAFCFIKLFGKGKKQDTHNAASFRPASPGAGKPCPNPEQHRHYEVRKPCPNPEPHGHYSAVTQPLTQFEQDAVARKKRLESMRILYNAGILTREEYDYEVRRIKNL